MTPIEDIMTRKVLTIAQETDLEDAAWGLTLKGFHGAPVKDEHGNIVGVLSKSDLTDPGRMGGGVPPKTAGDAMTPVLFTARATDPVRFAVERMVSTGSHRLIVVDESGKLVGIVTPMDVLKALLAGRLAPDEFQ